MLGDNLPPDYVTRVSQAPSTAGRGTTSATTRTRSLKGERPDLAGKVTVPDVLIQPHSAPLGMAFYDGAQFPPTIAATPSSRCTARGTAPSAPATRSCG